MIEEGLIHWPTKFAVQRIALWGLWMQIASRRTYTELYRAGNCRSTRAAQFIWGSSDIAMRANQYENAVAQSRLLSVLERAGTS
jgi:hypothetical protein